MAKKDTDPFLARSARALQHTAGQAGPAAGASYTLIGAILLLGGIGYAVDYWRGTSPWFLVGGFVLGVVVGMWELAKTAFSPKR
jgi:F0F1-type ATP synthase assembly protein I